MQKWFKAKIYWLTESEGGRKELPAGDKYAPIVKITRPLYDSEMFWSLFVVNRTTIGFNETLSDVSFLSEYAPKLLAKDVEFSLYEGSKLVAKGCILGSQSQRNQLGETNHETQSGDGSE